jgi:hypothetical protein
MKVSDTYTGRVTGYVGGHIYEIDKERSREASENIPYLGSAEEALESLREYEGQKFNDGVANLHTYITNNRNKVNYPAYKSRSLYIGSGPIESGNKVVVQRRREQSGMRRDVPAVQSMLTLRAKWESGRWDSDVRLPLLKAA